MYLGLSAYTDAVFWGCIQASEMGRSLLGTIAVQVGPLHPGPCVPLLRLTGQGTLQEPVSV